VDCAGRRVREALAALVDSALEKKLGESPGLLKDLALAGSGLCEALFAATDRADVAKRIRKYYSDDKQFALRFSVETSVFVPWGLVYPAAAEDVEKLPLPADITQPGDYGRFWCLSRELATVYDRIPPDAAGRGAGSEGLSIMRVINKETFDLVSKELAQTPEAQLLAWLDRVAPPILTSKALRQQWKAEGAKTGLLYFYCHANATKLSLGDDSIESADLLVTLAGASRAPDTPSCLLIINGCSTAVGDPKGDFMAAASQEGLCGFVGTETDVPDLFALRFSLALLYLLFREQLSIGAAMRRLYAEHFPLSLVYGLYAHPDVQMPKSDLPVFGRVANLSKEKAGAGKLGSRSS
jgi:hypothetical protein